MEPVDCPVLTKVRSMMQLVLALESVDFVLGLSSTRSSAATH